MLVDEQEVFMEKAWFMATVNKVILLGNIGRDPEIRYLPTFNPLASVEAVRVANCLSLNQLIQSHPASTIQLGVRRSTCQFQGMTKTLGFFSATKVNLRNAP
jgi:hypothetical protein